MISAWISQAATITGDSVNELDSREVDRIVDLIRRRFTGGQFNHRYLWEDFENDLSKRCADGWRRLCDFSVSHPVILFQSEHDFEGFSFASSDCLSRVLAESPGFEFYLTNPEVDFVICFNHHDYLICVGTSKDWLATIPEDAE